MGIVTHVAVYPGNAPLSAALLGKPAALTSEAMARQMPFVQVVPKQAVCV